jgi:hypothetical protein
LKGPPGDRTFAKKHWYFLRQRTLAGKVNITVYHSPSSSDYLKRPQIRPRHGPSCREPRLRT